MRSEEQHEQGMKTPPSLAIHYYFDDPHQHTMDALIKAKADLELLAALKELADLFQVQLQIETQALKRGSVVEVLSFVSEFKNAAALIALFGLIFTIYSYRDGREARELDKTSKQLSNQEKELQIQKLRHDLKQLEQPVQLQHNTVKLAERILDTSPKVLARRTQYFKTMMQQGDLRKIGFSAMTQHDPHAVEYVIDRENFHHMLVLPQKPLAELHANVIIEVIAPVLKPQRSAKWRGVYDQHEIYFTVTDRKFNQKVYSGQIVFSNGTRLRCNLEVRKRMDETGQESIFSYVVTDVYEDDIELDIQPLQAKSKYTIEPERHASAQKKSQLMQGDLFHS